MYTIEISTTNTISEKLKKALLKAVLDADESATCQIQGNHCMIRGSKMGPEQVSYLLGIATGARTSNEILKLILSYEKQQ